MEGYNAFSTPAMVNAFLEGELDEEWEQVLFRHLADDTDVRGELREYLMMNRLVAQDAVALVPPPSLHTGLRKTLGIGTSLGARFAGGITALVGSHKTFLLAGAYLGSIALTVFVTLALADFDRQDGAQGSVATAGSPAYPSMRNVSADTRPGLFGSAQHTDFLGDLQPLSALLGPAYSGDAGRSVAAAPAEAGAVMPPGPQENAFADLERDAARAATDTQPLSALPSHAVEAAEVMNTSVRPATPANELPAYAWLLPAAAAEDLAGSSPELSRMSIVLRGVAARRSDVSDLVADTEPLFFNMAAGLYWTLDNHWEVGLEVGQEKYFQQYDGEEGNRDVTYLQNPRLLWGAAGLRYNAKHWQLLPGLYPYAQALLGATRLGPLIRSSAGLSYTPENRVRFILGLESSVMVYNNQQNAFASDKLALTYGIQLSW